LLIIITVRNALFASQKIFFFQVSKVRFCKEKRGSACETSRKTICLWRTEFRERFREMPERKDKMRLFGTRLWLLVMVMIACQPMQAQGQATSKKEKLNQALANAVEYNKIAKVRELLARAPIPIRSLWRLRSS